MRRFCVLIILLFALIAGIAPGYAEGIDIDPAEPPLPSISEEEVDRITTLQSIMFPYVESTVSPDDAVFLASFFPLAQGEPHLAFIDVLSGEQTVVQPDVLDLSPFTEFVWIDNRTIGYVSARFDDTEEATPLLVAIDRDSGAVSTRDLELPGFPLSLSPDGRYLLIEAPPPDTEEAANRMPLHSSFDLTVHTRMPLASPSAHSTWLQRREAGQHTFASVAVPLVVLDLHTGALNDVTTLPEGSELLALSWNPDGTRLALSHTHIYEAYDLALTEFILSNISTREVMGRLDLAENPFYQNNVVEVFDLNAPGSAPLATARAPDIGTEILAGVNWSTDGQTLMVSAVQPTQIAGRPHPTFVFSADKLIRFFSPDLEPLAMLDIPALENDTISYARWASPDEIFFASAQGLNMSFTYYNWRSAELRVLPLPPGRINPYSWTTTRHSRQLVYGHSSLVQPPDLFRITWEGQAISRLTWTGTAAEELNQVQINRVEFRLANGARREGLLVQPQNAPFPPVRAPIVVWQLGGPGPWMGNEWGSWVEQPLNLLPNFGISVLIMPLSGRENYGSTFINALADNQNFGQIDIDEQAEVVNQMIRQGWTSRDRVGITGCSYGGYFTTQSIVRHPDLYAAANTQCSWIETIVDFQFVGAGLNAYLQGGSPQDSAAEYLRDSPLYNAARIETPTLIFHGTDDFQPIGLVQSLHDQIADNGVPVRMLTFLGEGHGLQAPESQLIAAEEQILWFRQYLGSE